MLTVLLKFNVDVKPDFKPGAPLSKVRKLYGPEGKF